MAVPGPSVSSVYVSVVEDVMIKVRDEFLASGAGDGLLDELQGLWETKLRQCGAVSGSFPRPSAWRSSAGAGVHDLNVPYAGSEVYQTPTADLLFPPTPFETPIQTPLPGNVDQLLYHMPTPAGLSDYDDPINYDIKPGKPNSYMDFFSASAKRKRDDSIGNFNSMGNLPQGDGAGEFNFEVIDSKQSVPKHDDHHSVTSHGEIYHANVDNLEDVEPPLNEDDDIVDDFDQINGEPDTSHLVLAQFDKVTRTKNKWKCMLRNGIMHINSRDILFNKANGDFEF